MYRTFRSLCCLLIVAALATVSCETLTSPSEPPDYALLDHRLEQAYAEESQTMLDEYFHTWSELIPAYTPQQVAAFSDTVRQAYRVFDAFYSPADLSRLTNGAHEDFETEFRYVVVQNSIEVAVVDTNPKFHYYRGVEVARKQIEDFRPPLDDVAYPAVYLSSQADSVIYDFLYEEDRSPRSDHGERVAFLREAIQLTHHHWISDYHKATMPVASTIYIDREFRRALVTFRVFYQFGDAYLERQGDTWTLISSELTAIE